MQTTPVPAQDGAGKRPAGRGLQSVEARSEHSCSSSGIRWTDIGTFRPEQGPTRWPAWSTPRSGSGEDALGPGKRPCSATSRTETCSGARTPSARTAEAQDSPLPATASCSKAAWKVLLSLGAGLLENQVAEIRIDTCIKTDTKVSCSRNETRRFQAS